jgi:hypothetical protein
MPGGSTAMAERELVGGRARLRGFALAALLGLPLWATACGSSSSGAAKSPGARPPSGVAVACQRVADVLSDGPDPGADPVGYALAQVLPLRQIKTSDAALKAAIDELAAAYESVYKTNAAAGTAAAVTKADTAVDKICPGATS